MPAPFSSAVPFSVTLKTFMFMRRSRSFARSAGRPRAWIFWRIHTFRIASWS